MQSSTEPAGTRQRDIIIRDQGGAAPVRLQKALEASLSQEAEATSALQGAIETSKGEVGSSLVGLKLAQAKARAGGYWNDSDEAWAKNKLSRIASGQEPHPIWRHRVERAPAHAISILQALGDGARGSLTTRDHRLEYDMRFFERGSFGTYMYRSSRATGDGRVLRLDSLETPNEARTGGLVQVVNRSPDNFDHLQGTVESGVWFTYTPESTGQLNLLAELTYFYDTRFRKLENEYGNSYCRVDQTRNLVFGSFDGDTPIGRRYIDVSSAASALTHYYGNGEGAGAEFTRDDTGRTGQVIRVGGAPGAWAVAGRPMDILVGCRLSIDSYLDDVGLEAWDGLGLKINFLGIRVEG